MTSEILKYFLVGSGIMIWIVILTIFAIIFSPILWKIIKVIYCEIVTPFYLITWIKMPINELKIEYDRITTNYQIVNSNKNSWFYKLVLYICRKRLNIMI